MPLLASASRAPAVPRAITVPAHRGFIAGRARAAGDGAGHDFSRVALYPAPPPATAAPVQRVIKNGSGKHLKSFQYYQKYAERYPDEVGKLERAKKTHTFANEREFAARLRELAGEVDPPKHTGKRKEREAAEDEPAPKKRMLAKPKPTPTSRQPGKSKAKPAPRQQAKKKARKLDNQLELRSPGTDPQNRPFARRLSFSIDDGDNPVTIRGQDYHDTLHRQGHGMSGNQIHSGISIHWDDPGRKDGVSRAFAPMSTTWQSGVKNPTRTAKINDLLDTLKTKGARTSEKIEHSEQHMGVEMTEDPDTLQEPLPALLEQMPKKANVRAIGLEMHSHPNSVCNPCQTTLDSLAQNQVWQKQFKEALNRAGHKTSKTSFVLRNSSDDAFPGAAKSKETASKLKDTAPTYSQAKVPKVINQLPNTLLGSLRRTTT